MVSSKNILAIRFDGPDLTPKSVDTVSTLGLVSAYLDLVVSIAGSTEALGFHGIKVIDKCAEVQIVSADFPRSVAAMEQANCLITGLVLPLFGQKKLLVQARRRLSLLPSDYECSVIVGEKKHVLQVDDLVDEGIAWEIITLRATPTSVGGIEPKVRLAPVGDWEETFTASAASSDQARKLGALLYMEIEVEVEVGRRPDGTIVDGKILSYEVLSEEDPKNAWRTWFSKVGSHWGDIEDIEAELERD